MIEIRQQSSTAMNAAVTGLTEAVRQWVSRCRNRAQRTRVESAAEQSESVSSRAVRTWKRL